MNTSGSCCTFSDVEPKENEEKQKENHKQKKCSLVKKLEIMQIDYIKMTNYKWFY